MPPTNASSSSTITSFSWWQCIIRPWASSSHWIFVPLHQPLARGLDHAAARLEDRHRRARPDEHAHRHALRGLGQQLPDRRGRCAGRGRSRARGARSRRGRGAGRCGSPRPSRAARSRRRSAPPARCPRAAATRGLRPQALGRRRDAPPAARGGAAGAGGGGSSRARCRRRRRRRSGRQLGRPCRIAVPASLIDRHGLRSAPPRSASPPSVSRCPCSRTIFDPAGMQERLSALETEMGAAGFWDDPDAAAKVGAEHTRTQRRLDDLHEAAVRRRGPRRARRARRRGPGASPAEFEEAIASVETRLQAAEEQRLFTGDYDAGDALVTVNAGAGGTDAQDWAEMVLRMEMRWAERRGFKVELLEASAGEEAGIKSATFRVVRRQRLRALLGREGRAPARAAVAVRLRQPPPDVVRGRRGRAGGRGGGRRRDRGRRPAGRHLPRVRRRRPARQQDRLRRAHHPPADRDRRPVPERALAVGQPRDRDGDAARQADRAPGGASARRRSPRSAARRWT